MAERRKERSPLQKRAIEDLKHRYGAVLNEPIPENLKRLVDLLRRRQKDGDLR